MNLETQKLIFSQNLRRLLEERNVKQIDVADAIGVSHQLMNTWVRGKAYPRPNRIQLLASYFGVRVADLVELQLPESRISKLAAMMEAHPIYWEVIDAVSGMDEEGLRLAIRLLRTMKEAGNE